jgi:hypothetical protein
LDNGALVSVELEWRWADPSGQQRAVRTDELRAALAGGIIAPNTPVWRSGWPEWKPAYDVPELTTSALASANGVVQNIPPPPLFMVAVQHEYEDKAVPSVRPPFHTEPPPPPSYVPSPTKPPAPVPPPPAEALTPSKAAMKAAPPVSPTAMTTRGLPAPPPDPSEIESEVSVRPEAPKLKMSVPAPPNDESWDAIEAFPASVEVPPPEPSETLAGSSRPQGDEGEASEANTAVDITVLSPADAERVLAINERTAHHRTEIGVPSLEPALPPPPPLKPPSLAPPVPPMRPSSSPLRTPTLSQSKPPPKAGSSTPPPLPARARKDTLLLFGGLPSAPQAEKEGDGPPIVVPGPAEKAPKAVTQAPPWTEGGARIDPQIPKAPPAMRPRAVSIEEIGDDMLVPDSADSSSAAVTAQRQKVDELSGAALLPDGLGSGHVEVPPPPPLQHPRGYAAIPADVSRAETTGPRRLANVTERVIHDLKGLLASSQPKWLLPVLAASGAAISIGLVAIIATLFGSTHNDHATKPAGAVADVRSIEPAPAVVAPSEVQPSPRTSGVACTVGGVPHVIAPKASVPSGVEAVSEGGKVALGFAAGPKEGMVVELEPLTMSVSSVARVHSHETIRRVTPLVVGKLGALADTDRKSDRLQGARAVSAEPPFVVGASEGQLAWAAHASDTPKMLWPLRDDGAIEALRVIRVGHGYALAFRQSGAIWLGAMHVDKSPDGLLSKVDSLGPAVGAPTLAASGDVVLVAWADRASSSDPWGIRWTRWTPGDAPSAPQSFTLPEGGLGEQAMSPALAGLGGGRFLLVWTEGPVSSHQVRAQTLAPSGSPVGAPLVVSAEGVNAGQGQVAVADGHGVAAFLASNGSGFEVVATPVTCPTGAM